MHNKFLITTVVFLENHFSHSWQEKFLPILLYNNKKKEMFKGIILLESEPLLRFYVFCSL